MAGRERITGTPHVGWCSSRLVMIFLCGWDLVKNGDGEVEH